MCERQIELIMTKPPRIIETSHIREWRNGKVYHREDGPSYDDGVMQLHFNNGECKNPIKIDSITPSNVFLLLETLENLNA